MSADLKECPFCGAKPVMSEKGLDERFGYANQVTIHCGSCGVCKSAQGDISKPGYADNSTTGTRAIEAWNRRPIAPPVAAGSVETPEFEKLMERWSTAGSGKFGLHEQGVSELRTEFIDHINSWGAQQRQYGWVAGQMINGVEIFDPTESAALAAAERLLRDAVIRAEKAEARVKELEDRFLTVAHHPV